MALTENQVKKISLAYQANEGNAEGVAFWVNSGVNEATAASFFYAANASLQSLSGVALATKIFENLGLNAETHPGFNQEGLAFWGNLIDSGAVPKDQAGLVIANAVRDNLGLTDDTFTQHIEKIKDITPITPSGDTFMLTEGVDYADASKSTHDDVADTFKFTDASEKITATFAQLSKGDQLIDLSNADNDTLDLSLDINNVKQTIGSKNGATLVNIEELDITSRGAKNITFDNTISAAGLKTIKIAGAFLNDKGNDGNGFTFSGNVLKTLTTIDASAITAGNVNIDASKATQDLTITGSNFAASINGGSGNDTITGQGTINAGAGDDIITITGKSDVTGDEGNDTFDVQAGKVTITDLGAGKDIIKVAAGAEVTATVTGEFVVSESNYVNDGSVTFKVATDVVLDLSEADGNITSIEITGSGAKVVGTVGDDTITVSGASGTVEGGEGDDTITLASGHAAKTTIVFAATAAANGEDEITGFKAGTDAVVLNFAAFLGKTTASTASSGGLGSKGSGVGISSSGFNATASSAGNVIYVNDKAELTKENFGSSADKNVIKVAASADYVVIAKDNNTSTIYYVEVGTDKNNATVTPVGTINTPSDAFVTGNFA